MIQIIKNDIKEGTDKIEVNSFSNPKSLDQYDINIINLNDKNIWNNSGGDYQKINLSRDLKNLGVMIDNSKKTTIIVVLPQDQSFKYDYRSRNGRESERYQKSVHLKNILYSLKENILSNIIRLKSDLIFENTYTNINNKKIKSSFYVNDISEDEIVTKSLGSDKVTTFLLKEKLYVTTLELENPESINDFLLFLGLNDKKEEAPTWINDIEFFNDKEEKEKIVDSQEEIDNLEKEISLSTKQLEENLKYKSILYTNGDELVEIVFDILKTMFDYDLDSFIDEKKEDFIIKLDDITLIGEIKGVNSSIKSGHISQLDVHYQGYLDNLAETEQSEVAKSILIINHQRNRNIGDRISVHETQNSLAKRNGSLIIETTTLLKLFEKFKRSELSIEEFKYLIKNNNGLLEI